MPEWVGSASCSIMRMEVSIPAPMQQAEYCRNTPVTPALTNSTLSGLLCAPTHTNEWMNLKSGNLQMFADKGRSAIVWQMCLSCLWGLRAQVFAVVTIQLMSQHFLPRRQNHLDMGAVNCCSALEVSSDGGWYHQKDPREAEDQMRARPV